MGSRAADGPGEATSSISPHRSSTSFCGSVPPGGETASGAGMVHVRACGVGAARGRPRAYAHNIVPVDTPGLRMMPAGDSDLAIGDGHRALSAIAGRLVPYFAKRNDFARQRSNQSYMERSRLDCFVAFTFCRRRWRQ